ncbi:MAG: hypothetical protein NTV87_05465 [Ignavibacteriae bacterium]|nr:hypothetical protein [Ignavibacteriota bacterium]
MKYFQLYTSLVLLILVMLISGGNLAAQTPQYYNFSGGTGYNTIPFTTAAGRGINNLYLAGEFNQPAPLPAGNNFNKYLIKNIL